MPRTWSTRCRCVLPADEVVGYPSWETLPARAALAARGHGRPAAGGAAPARPPRARRPGHRAGAGGGRVDPGRAAAAGAGLGDLEPVAARVGDVVDLEDLVERLVAVGYARVELVEKRGEFAVRGGILDVFPPTEEHPVRVEFWGDDVEEVRYFTVADHGRSARPTTGCGRRRAASCC
jgi:transcription-repair coupling factor (superfamily II helicase)